jgi:glycine/D-amino acid oxidase-like deaminating enzyme
MIGPSGGSRQTALVVGAGIFGACIAHRLASRGWGVTLVDQAVPGHVRATSSGDTRVMRCGHGDDRWYTAWAWRAQDLWRELEQRTGHRMLVITGVAWFAHTDDGWEHASAVTLDALGIPYERLRPDEAARLWPSLGTDDLAWVLLEPHAGHLLARPALQAIVEHAAVGLGVEVVLGHAEPAGDGVRVNGTVRRADHVVWAAGPWLGQIFGPALSPIDVVRREYFHFGAGDGWVGTEVPAWVDYDRAIYGLGNVGGAGVKVAPDDGAEPFDPDLGHRLPSADGEATARAYLAERFPALAAAPTLGGRVCQYELTRDTRFLVGRHPEHPGVVLVGGGSGHGFKHGPVLAEYVADLLEEPGREPDPQFALGARPAGTSLRTAGVR